VNSLYRLWTFLEVHFLEEPERFGSGQKNVIETAAGCAVRAVLKGRRVFA
jgi:hypothetical protein